MKQTGNLKYFLLTGRKGAQHTYHRGLLMFDRQCHDMAESITAEADAAAEAYRQGQVTLVQRHHGPFDHEYVAVMR